jgi:hypothetical protein
MRNVSIVVAPLHAPIPDSLGAWELKRQSGVEGKAGTRFGSNVGTEGTGYNPERRY